MIDVGDEIARFEVAEFFQCNGLGPGVPSPRPVFIIAIENLVICITGRLQVQVSKAFSHGKLNGAKRGRCVLVCARQVVENSIRSEEQTSELQSLMRSSYAVF